MASTKTRILHRPPHDKTSRLSFDTALYTLMSTNTYTEMPDEQKKKEEKKRYSQTSRLENPEELQLNHNCEKLLFCLDINYW
jgi:hypothetical protein